MDLDLETLLREGARSVLTLHGMQREWENEDLLDREVWVAVPDRAREENAREVVARHAGGWWRRSPDGTVVQGELDVAAELQVARRARAWMDPGDVMGLLDLSLIDTGAVAERPSLILRATLREGADPLDARLWWLGFNADEWLLEVDADRGIVLATEARKGGSAHTGASFLSLEYDEPLPDPLFERP